MYDASKRGCCEIQKYIVRSVLSGQALQGKEFYDSPHLVFAGHSIKGFWKEFRN